MSIRIHKIKHVATGGAGDVFLGIYVTEAGMKRLCAIKQPRNIAGNESEITQFRNEAEMCKYFSHQNIVQLHEYAVIDGAPAMILEFVMGRSLQWVCDRIFGTGIWMAPSMIATIASETAAALDYIHNLRHPFTSAPFRVVHRDVTPSNLLLSFNGDVKLSDFGIYKGNNRDDQTNVGLVKGTVSYVSPEQLRGEAATPVSDLYGLGVVLWQLLAGRRLFGPNTDITTIMMRTAAGDIPKDVREVNPDAHRNLAATVSRLLSRNPADRYPSARDLRRHFELMLTNEFGRFTRDKLGFFVESIDDQSTAELRKLATDAMNIELEKPRGEFSSAFGTGEIVSSRSSSSRSSVLTNEGSFGGEVAPTQDDGGLKSKASLKRGRDLDMTPQESNSAVRLQSASPTRSGSWHIVQPPQRQFTRSSALPEKRSHLGIVISMIFVLVAAAVLYILWIEGAFGS